jgi:hypothetical protein
MDVFDVLLDDGHVRVNFITALTPEQNQDVNAMLEGIGTRDALESRLAELGQLSGLLYLVFPPRELT